MRRCVLAFLLVFVSCELLAQDYARSVEVFFNQGSDVIINGSSLDRLNALLCASPEKIICVDIEAYSSPEGSEQINYRLSQLRCEAVREYLCRQMPSSKSKISLKPEGVAWEKLKVICQGQEFPGDFMLRHIYPHLRYAKITVHKFTPVSSGVVLDVEHKDLIFKEFACDIPLIESCDRELKPVLALKTNLLFDVLSLINVEIEIPIKKRWSLALEYIFPWWVMDNAKADSRRNRVQLLNGTIEGRYWWGDRSLKPILTGWFAGVYFGAGMYDFEWKGIGFQGEFFTSLGLSGGYAHTINKSRTLRMEYSLGVGYLATDYEHYHAEFCINEHWHAIEQYSGRYWWLGPTRAKVSLSWLINCRKEK